MGKGRNRSACGTRGYLQSSGADARRIANPLSGLSKWKIFDNLRRSLVPAALLFLMLGSWIFLPELGSFGSLVVLFLITLPGVLATLFNLIHKPDALPGTMHLRGVIEAAARQLGQVFLALTFLPYDAYFSLDAIGKTLLRLTITRRRLLEWQTSSESERKARTDLNSFYKKMWVAPFVSMAIGIFLATTQPSQLLFALPILGYLQSEQKLRWLRGCEKNSCRH